MLQRPGSCALEGLQALARDASQQVFELTTVTVHSGGADSARTPTATIAEEGQRDALRQHGAREASGPSSKVGGRGSPTLALRARSPLLWRRGGPLRRERTDGDRRRADLRRGRAQRGRSRRTASPLSVRRLAGGGAVSLPAGTRSSPVRSASRVPRPGPLCAWLRSAACRTGRHRAPPRVRGSGVAAARGALSPTVPLPELYGEAATRFASGRSREPISRSLRALRFVVPLPPPAARSRNHALPNPKAEPQRLTRVPQCEHARPDRSRAPPARTSTPEVCMKFEPSRASDQHLISRCANGHLTTSRSEDPPTQRPAASTSPPSTPS